MQKLTGFTQAFLCTALAVFLLYAASNLLIPLLIAIIISFLVIAIAEGILRLHFYSIRIPSFIAYSISLFLLALFGWVIFFIVTSNVTALIASAGFYQQRLNELFQMISRSLKLPPLNLAEQITQFDMTTAIRSILKMLTDIAGNTGLIVVYTIFLLTEYHFFPKKLAAIFRKKESLEKTKNVIQTIKSQIHSYLRIKTFLSFLTSICSYAVLLAVGIDFADFWAFLIFLLNFIPTIGSIIATIFPCLLALLQFTSIWPFVFVTLFLSAIQFIIGNIIEPRLMGKTFNLSGLVILLSLAVWGQIWGIIGMFLCVPILVIANIIFSNFPQTKPIAILFSQDGKIE